MAPDGSRRERRRWSRTSRARDSKSRRRCTSRCGCGTKCGTCAAAGPIHLIVEANDHECLARGMQGLCVRIAKALNVMMQRKGRVFADHYYSRLLLTPTQLVNAIRYVLENHTHHFGEKGVDPFSSAALRS